MIAYLHGKVLCIVLRPCNGEEYQKGEKIYVGDKKTARAICKSRGITPWNF